MTLAVRESPGTLPLLEVLQWANYMKEYVN
jgi:hypothetical protein